MRKSSKTWLLGVLLATLPTLASAQGAYIGGSVTRLLYNDERPNDDTAFRPAAAYMRLGYEPTNYFGIEIRGGLGFSADEHDGIRLEQKHFYGAYITLGAPVGDLLRPYIIAGYTQSQFTTSTSLTSPLGTVTVQDTQTREDGSWGFGIDINLSENLAVNLEYMHYLDKETLEMSGLSLGVRSSF